jgi:hypothetical protein
MGVRLCWSLGGDEMIIGYLLMSFIMRIKDELLSMGLLLLLLNDLHHELFILNSALFYWDFFSWFGYDHVDSC